MKTPEPLTIERLYELCELAKTSPKGKGVKISWEEFWALVEMAKQTYSDETRKENAHWPVPTNETGNATKLKTLNNVEIAKIAAAFSDPKEIY